MPEWMADAGGGSCGMVARLQALWREHQEFRAAFSSPEEARAIKELLPGGVRDVLSLREATQSVDRIDAAIFSGDARAQSEVVAELARANPAAFRSMFAEAAKVLAGMGSREAMRLGGLRRSRQAGTRSRSRAQVARRRNGHARQARRRIRANHQSRITSHESPVTSHTVTNHQSRRTSIPRLMRRLSDLRTMRWRGMCAGRSATRWRG